MIEPVFIRNDGRIAEYPDHGTIASYKDGLGFQIPSCSCEQFQRTQWCEGVKKFSTEDDGAEAGDHKNLFPMMQLVVYKRPWLIIPTTALLMNDSRTFEIAVYWGDIEMRSGVLHSDGREVVGYIYAKDDGREAVRQMILQWLPGIPYAHQAKMVCRASAHTPGECWFDVGYDQSQIVAAARPVKENTEAFCLLDKGACRSCLESMALPIF